jgi:hypothetical protein
MTHRGVRSCRAVETSVRRIFRFPAVVDLCRPQSASKLQLAIPRARPWTPATTTAPRCCFQFDTASRRGWQLRFRRRACRRTSVAAGDPVLLDPRADWRMDLTGMSEREYWAEVAMRPRMFIGRTSLTGLEAFLGGHDQHSLRHGGPGLSG